MVPHMAAIFNAAGNVYAPAYRHMVGVGYFAGAAGEVQAARARDEAMDLAYSDVADAFREFLRRVGSEDGGSRRPLIIAGHSQGAEHAARIVLEFFDADGAEAAALRERLAVAYLVGMPMFQEHFSRVAVCNGPDDTGCIVSWQTYVEGADTTAFKVWPASSALRPARSDEAQVCVNPLSWRTVSSDGGVKVPASVNAGSRKIINAPQNMAYLAGVLSAVARLNATVPVLQAGVISARCDSQGILRVDAPPNLGYGFGPFPLWRGFAFPPGDNLHPFDFNYFWLSTRLNAMHRAGIVKHKLA